MIESIKHISVVVFGQQKDYPIAVSGNYTETPEGVIIEDSDVVKFTLDHMNWFDKLNPSKVIVASLYAFDMILGDKKQPNENWKFKFRK